METKTKVYNKSKIQDKERYLEAFTNLETEEVEINLDEFKQVVIENEFIDISELLKEFNEVFIIPHDAENENFVNDENIQHYHIYIKTDAHNNTIYKKINNIKRIDKQTFIKQLHNLNKTKINFTNEKKIKEERILKMKKTLLHYNTITNFLNEIPRFSGAVIVKEDGSEVALGDRKSGFSKKELENLKNNTSQRVPLYIQYILTLADNLTTEERKKFEENLKKEFGNKVIINNNNAKQIVFTIQNYEIENDILKIHKITNTHLKILKFLNENGLNVINMNERKDYIFKHIKYKEEDIKDINKYVTKPITRLYEDYIKEEAQVETKTKKQEVKETSEQKQTEKEEININEIKDEEIKQELENIDNEIEQIKQSKYIAAETKKQIIKELETKKTDLYNRYLEKLEEEKKQQIEKLKKDLENKEEEIKKIKKDLENLRIENEELREERNKLNEKLEKIQNEIEQLQKLLNEKDQDINRKEEIINNLNNKLDEYNKIVNNLNKQIEKLNNKIKNVENKNKKLIKENKELKTENKKLEESIKRVNKEVKIRDEIIEKQKEQIKNLEEQIQQKDKELAEKNKKIEELQNIIKDFNVNYISKQKAQEIYKKEFKKEVSKNYVKKDEVEKLEKKLKEVENKNKQIVDLVVKLLDNLDLSEEEKQEIINKFTNLSM